MNMSEMDSCKLGLKLGKATNSPRSVVSALFLGVGLLPSIACGFNLVTTEEAVASAKYEAANPASMFSPRTRAFNPTSPRIEVVSPDLSSTAALQSPVKIQVKFESAEKAEIVPGTFKAQYGAFRIDITDRLLKATKVTKEGIIVDKAELPSGSHRLFLKVQDSADRTGEQEVRFTVQ